MTAPGKDDDGPDEQQRFDQWVDRVFPDVSAVLVLHLEGDAPLLVTVPHEQAHQCAAAVCAYWEGEAVRPLVLQLGAGDTPDTWVPLARITAVRVLGPAQAARLYPHDIDPADQRGDQQEGDDDGA